MAISNCLFSPTSEKFTNVVINIEKLKNEI